VATVFGLTLIGPKACIGFILLISILLLDEIFCNIFDRKRYTFTYFVFQLFFIVPFVYFHFVYESSFYNNIFIKISLLVNIVLCYFLFAVPLSEKPEKLRLYYWFSLPMVFFPMYALAAIFKQESWPQLFLLLLLVNFGMDTGAWFFGKNFGKTKLWPEVSPNKTIEGLIGGVLTSVILGSIMWWNIKSEFSIGASMFFGVLAVVSQMGDLVESKIKRQFGVKDTSQLIPGHGGVYDRVDSLIFVAPIYAAALKFLLRG
jgi:phosphatidate cytidylyltransferase